MQKYDININDTVVFTPRGSQAKQMMKVEKIGTNKKNPSAARIFVSHPHRLTGRVVSCTEDQIVQVITQSKDDEKLWTPNRPETRELQSA